VIVDDIYLKKNFSPLTMQDTRQQWDAVFSFLPFKQCGGIFKVNYEKDFKGKVSVHALRKPILPPRNHSESLMEDSQRGGGQDRGADSQVNRLTQKGTLITFKGREQDLKSTFNVQWQSTMEKLVQMLELVEGSIVYSLTVEVLIDDLGNVNLISPLSLDVASRRIKLYVCEEAIHSRQKG